MSDQRSSLDDAADPVCAAPQRLGSFCAAEMSSPRSRSRSSGVKIVTTTMLIDEPLIGSSVSHSGTPRSPSVVVSFRMSCSPSNWKKVLLAVTTRERIGEYPDRSHHGQVIGIAAPGCMVFGMRKNERR